MKNGVQYPYTISHEQNSVRLSKENFTCIMPLIQSRHKKQQIANMREIIHDKIFTLQTLIKIKLSANNQPLLPP